MRRTDTRFRPPRRVLHVEGDTFLAALVHATLEDADFEVDRCPSADAALAGAAAAAYDVCLFAGDLRVPMGETPTRTVSELARDAPIVILADELGAGVDTAHVSMLSTPVPPCAAVESAVLETRRAA